MATLSIPFSFVAATPAKASEVNSNFNAVATFLNSTKINSDNIQTGGVATANLADGAVTTAKIDVGAVTNSKLGGVYSAKIIGGVSPSATNMYGASASWISSITRNGAGDYSINIAGGIFSVEPNVIATATTSNTSITVASSGSGGFRVTSSTGSDTGMYVIAMGN